MVWLRPKAAPGLFVVLPQDKTEDVFRGFQHDTTICRIRHGLRFTILHFHGDGNAFPSMEKLIQIYIDVKWRKIRSGNDFPSIIQLLQTADAIRFQQTEIQRRPRRIHMDL